MRELKRSRSFMAFLACAISVLPARDALTAEQIPVKPPAVTVQDFALGRAGTLAGKILDETGRPSASQRVVAKGTRGEPVTTVSDRHGRFTLTGLRGGIYEISTERASVACRCWTASAAPPRAAREILLIAQQDVQRGQRPVGDLLSGPVLIGLIIAAAIVIPIAVHNSQKSAS